MSPDNPADGDVSGGGDPVVDVAAVLADHPLSSVLSPEVRQALAGVSEVQRLDAGTVVMTQGAPGDAAYLVVSGRLRVVTDGVFVGTAGPGEIVGEMALLTGEQRTATVLARRPSVVIRIGADDFLRVLAEHPETHRALSRLLVERMTRLMAGRPVGNSFATVLAVGGHDDELTAQLADRLVVALRAIGVTVAETDDDLTDLVALEAANEVVVVRGRPDALAVKQAWFDRTVLVVAAADAPSPLPGATTVTDGVIVHPERTRLPGGSARHLGDRTDLDLHHIRLARHDDLARLARRLLGREQVLVLSGGGARGLVHLGVIRALHERRVAIDALVGVSAGGLMAAPLALDWDPAEAEAVIVDHLVDGGSMVDLTIPLVAVSSGRRITEGVQRTYGADVGQEDLWRPLALVSADLAGLALHLHTRGPLWRALRASIAVPGVFPPLVDDDRVLVDGGVVEHLPVKQARRLYPGATIISSEVGRRSEGLTVDLPPEGIVDGWQAAWDRVRHRRDTSSMVRLLYRLTALGGGATAPVHGDVHIEHTLEGLGMFDFAKGRPAIEAGYRTAVEVLDGAELPVGP